MGLMPNIRAITVYIPLNPKPLNPYTTPHSPPIRTPRTLIAHEVGAYINIQYTKQNVRI